MGGDKEIAMGKWVDTLVGKGPPLPGAEDLFAASAQLDSQWNSQLRKGCFKSTMALTISSTKPP